MVSERDGGNGSNGGREAMNSKVSKEETLFFDLIDDPLKTGNSMVTKFFFLQITPLNVSNLHWNSLTFLEYIFQIFCI